MPHAEKWTILREIRPRHTEEWRTKFSQRRENRLGVPGLGFHQDVEILLARGCA